MTSEPSPTVFPAPKAVPQPPSQPFGFSRTTLGFGLFLLFLALPFAKPILELVRFAWKSSESSYVLLIPFVSFYLLRLKEPDLLQIPRRPSWFGAGVSAVLGVTCLVAWQIAASRGWLPEKQDPLFLAVYAYLCFAVGAAFVVFGPERMRLATFPIGLLLLAAPFPSFFSSFLKLFFQVTSTWATQIYFDVFRTPYWRDGFVFHLSNISLRVAEECSGINSSVVLFIVSLIAGHMFLRSNWKRAFLTCFVIPLGIMRNGFRIFTLGMLCVHVSPDMIDSAIHHKGGPIFFALSLIPFFLLLLFLRRSENRKAKVPNL